MHQFQRTRMKYVGHLHQALSVSMHLETEYISFPTVHQIQGTTVILDVLESIEMMALQAATLDLIHQGTVVIVQLMQVIHTVRVSERLSNTREHRQREGRHSVNNLKHLSPTVMRLGMNIVQILRILGNVFDTPHFAYRNGVIPFTITTYTEEADPIPVLTEEANPIPVLASSM
ncbi:hypothetical protein IFM89_014536 [Coptis chinensis]|uniref:Uncharacterized protein n=1 Tax=Coptis chinensis TaxID=261450 RepID=A0A835H353_9MAGN|nr:hypothetical protein IFM89_014536 [Coptis chinensis]